mmetsp:Transcript_27323/g.43328  ORF Transcript_27323/g.43328 Transcript_27323/m.43328 type:complete len:245 (+) Transcript_27323:112-846(+)
MKENSAIAFINPPFEADEHGVARWRKVKSLRQCNSGGKELLVANQRPDDGLGLPPTFVVEKMEKKALKPRAWDGVAAALAIMATMGMNTTNLIKYYGAWHDGASVYLVSEYCSGDDLFTKVSNESFRNRRDHVRQMLKGLKDFHRIGLCHPGIGLENFVLSHDGSVKLGGGVSWGMSNDSSIKSNIHQVGGAIYALVHGEHLPKPYVRQPNAAAAEDFFQLLLCDTPDLQLALSRALDHPWLPP